VAEAEEASDEVMAAIAAGGTYSFVPEPDEDETVLPGEDDLVDAAAEALLAEPAPAPVPAAEEVEEAEQKPRATRARSRKAAAVETAEGEEPAAVESAEGEEPAAVASAADADVAAQDAGTAEA
jgi:hypothetical protein